MKKFNKKLAKILIGIACTIMILLGALRYSQHGNSEMHRVSGIKLPFIGKPSLDSVRALDRQNNNATFVFVNQVPGVSAMHNRVIMLPPIGDELRIDFNQYLHKGHPGPLYIILPDNYAGPKEKFILKAFPDYKGWYGSMLSDKFVMYAAK